MREAVAQPVSNPGGPRISSALQTTGLTPLLVWRVRWDLSHNPSRNTRAQMDAVSTNRPLLASNNEESNEARVSEGKGLGVLVTRGFNSSIQCKYAYNPARRILFLIVYLYWSHLEYLCLACSPYLGEDDKHRHRLQRLAKRLLVGLK